MVGILKINAAKDAQYKVRIVNAATNTTIPEPDKNQLVTQPAPTNNLVSPEWPNSNSNNNQDQLYPMCHRNKINSEQSPNLHL
jgi:hypothetical protein